MTGFADGLLQGVNTGLRLMDFNDQRQRRKKQDERADKEYDRQDKTQSAMDKANQDAMAAYQAHVEQGKAAAAPTTEERSTFSLGDAAKQPSMGGPTMSLSQPASLQAPQQDPQQGMTLAGSMAPGGAVQPVGGTEQVTKPGPAYDEREGVLAGMAARRKSLMTSGVDAKLWMDDWGKESALRGQIRTETADKAEKAYRLTGDFGAYAKAVYPLIDDGHEIIDAKPDKTLDGKTGWTIVRKDAQGKETSMFRDEDTIRRDMLAVHDP
jgi:hypothetical protein